MTGYLAPITMTLFSRRPNFSATRAALTTRTVPFHESTSEIPSPGVRRNVDRVVVSSTDHGEENFERGRAG